MRKIIVPVGYMGSGSSAITDLIREFAGVNNEFGTMEYVFLHCPDGVFDLEDKLLIGNNALRADEALHSFLNRMHELYNKKFWWVGDYEKKIGPKFYERSQAFVQELVNYETPLYWYMQERVNFSMFLKLLLRKIIKLITFNKVLLDKPLRYRPMYLSYPTDLEFYQKARNYVRDCLNMFDSENDILLDQLLLPHNLFRIDNYFDDNLKVIVVDRDPRDIFLSNKYIWKVDNEPVPYSCNVEEFCDQFKRIRQMEKPASSKKILRIHFEDLIYKYDDTLKTIIKFLGYEKVQHINKRKYFIPEESIKNTQLFKNKKYAKEAKYIAENLKEYLYKFPEK